MYKYVKDKDNGNSGINVYEENTIFWSKTGEPEPHVCLTFGPRAAWK